MHFLIACSFHRAAIADHFRAVARALLGRGHRVTLLTWGQDARGHFGVEGAELLRFPSPRPTGWQDIRFAWSVLREGRVDCAVANFGSENAVVLAGVLAGTRVRVAWYHTLIEQIVRDRGGWGPGLAMQVARKRLFYSMETQLVGNSRRGRWVARILAFACPKDPLFLVFDPGSAG